jgi:UDP-glucose 6-dehydrogenase
MKIAIAGVSYLELSSAMLLPQNHEVVVYEPMLNRMIDDLSDVKDKGYTEIFFGDN